MPQFHMYTGNTYHQLLIPSHSQTAQGLTHATQSMQPICNALSLLELFIGQVMYTNIMIHLPPMYSE